MTFCKVKMMPTNIYFIRKKHLIYHFFQDKKTDIQCTWIPQYYFAKETHKIWNSILMDVRWDCDLFFLPCEWHLSHICCNATSFFSFITLSSVFFMLHGFWGRIRLSTEGSYLNRTPSSSCALGGTGLIAELSDLRKIGKTVSQISG